MPPKQRAWALQRVFRGRYRETFYVEDPDGSVALARPLRSDEHRIRGPGTHSDETIVEAIRLDIGEPAVASQVQKCALSPGEYHPRVWRGEFLAYDAVRLIRPLSYSVQAPTTLFDRMRVIAQTVQPHPDNAKAFGHELRNLLILSCTQVEAALKAILKANGYVRSDATERFTTIDYVKLADPMRLREWKVGMPLYLDWGEMQPFRDWDPASATKSLPWYQAYNDTKHDAEDKLHLATFTNAATAVAAVFVMLVAQFGTANFGKGGLYHVEDFWVVDQPKWKNGELYPPRRGYDDLPDAAQAVPLFGSA